MEKIKKNLKKENRKMTTIFSNNLQDFSKCFVSDFSAVVAAEAAFQQVCKFNKPEN